MRIEDKVRRDLSDYLPGSERAEPTVRAELMEQVPHLAMFCQENRPSIPHAFSKYLLPIVVRYLADQNNQVRKTSQAALLVLLEQELIERSDVESKVCPVLIELTAPDSNDDVKTEAVAIMCKMASMVGKDITERLILPRFCEMCCDCRMFHVRKVCAANFGDICSVVGQDATEKMLLPRFFQLCSDNVWGVRKACAECFMAVSCATSQELRRTKLSALFINLISDPSRWVRQAAFQSLGPFISTFANPSSSGQYFKDDDCKNMDETPSEEVDRNTIKAVDSAEEHVLLDNFKTEDLSSDGSIVNFNVMLEDDFDGPVSERDLFHKLNIISSCTLPLESVVASNEFEQTFAGTQRHKMTELPIANSTATEQELYNSFHYWRTPIPKLDIDLELLQSQAETCSSQNRHFQKASCLSSPSITMASRKELEEVIENLEPHIDDPDVKD
ncbi:hypothetical protein GDO86_005251 [Hymenochirus boettgeri]|uniref:Putative WW-binding domain-containing protein n=1 Tax=Hymenochirus boettgeri TaxID=247094 RepID=A0A8T2J3X0_9PIPI|nr:hypothetical protein GDO86_005251 [Hymenochirus boettgeri]